MMIAYQQCRVCGIRVPAGFTNCDGCYHKTDKTKAEKINYRGFINGSHSLFQTSPLKKRYKSGIDVQP